MLILPQTIKTKWNSKHKSYYESKGYVYTKMGDEFEVKVLDLPLTSQIKVSAVCDYCGSLLYIGYGGANPGKKISCKHCRPKRMKEEFGYSSNWELEKTKQTIKQTFLNKYGVDHNFKAKEVQEKRKQTFLKKYGVEHPFLCKEINEKKNKTLINKYGSICSLNNKTVKQKAINTLIKNYGVDHPFKIQSNKTKNRIKANKTLYKNITASCSKQQRYLHNLLGGELNYPVDRCLLDIAFPDEMIYIEYNGGGHDLQVKLGNITKEQFNTQEIKRYNYLKSKGWKLIRITSSKDYLINDIDMKLIFNECLELLKNSSWIEINIDKLVMFNNQFNKKLSLNIFKL